MQLVNLSVPRTHQSEVDQQLAKSTVSNPFEGRNTTIAWGYISMHENLGAAVREAALLGPLVDLGAGDGCFAQAAQYGFLQYIAVDKFEGVPPGHTQTIFDFPARVEKIGEIENVQIKGDMLEFLNALPDQCCSINVSGIDSAVIRSDKYHEALASQIMRVLIPGGVAFGMLSEPLSILNQRLEGSPALAIQLDRASLGPESSLDHFFRRRITNGCT